mmetsp:Transcript_12941/g.25092  ORF Transcript_12941/g.25092 Transcript_12941/m.25092 type:complete len:239 (-) Transcript_12941:433-1149(-)
MEIYQEPSTASRAGFRALQENFGRRTTSKKELREVGDGAASAAKSTKKGLGGPNTVRRALGDISNNNNQSTGRAGKGSGAGFGGSNALKQKPPRFNLNLKKGGLVVHEEAPVETKKPTLAPQQSKARVKTALKPRVKQTLEDDFEFDTCNRRMLSPSPEYDGGFDVDAALAAGRASSRRKVLAANANLKARTLGSTNSVDDLLAGIELSSHNGHEGSIGEPDTSTSLDLSDLCEDLEF